MMMLSARAGEESRLEGFQAGADDYLTKPFTARELLAKVEARLLRARIQRVEETTRRRIAAVFEQAPVPIAILRGPDYVFEMANEAYLGLVNRDVIGQPIADALPEVVEQGIVGLLEGVRTTGRAYVGRALPVNRTRSSPSTTRAGIGSLAQRRVRPAMGSSASEATATRLPNRRPRIVPGSASRHTSPNTDRRVATCARANDRGGPSAMFAM